MLKNFSGQQGLRSHIAYHMSYLSKKMRDDPRTYQNVL